MGERGGCGGWAPWMILLLTLSATAQGQEPPGPVSAADRPSELFQLRLRYGVSVRSGSQVDASQPGLSYQGLTPNDLAFQGWGWFLLGRHLGLYGSVQREAFALFEGTDRVTGGGLVRASAGPAGRLILGPVRLEAAVGYGFSQLPIFATPPGASFPVATRHAVLLSARGVVELGPVSIEARGEYPISLGATDGLGGKGRATGYSAGGAVRVGLVRTGELSWGLLADVSYVSDRLTSSSAGLAATQSMIRVGGALDLKWQEEPEPVAPPPQLGGLEVRVTDAATGAPLPGAEVEIGGQPQRADRAGVARVDALPLGPVQARASAAGYLPEQGEGTIAAGGLARIELKLKREPPKVGSLVIKVVHKEKKTPIAKATVKAAEGSAVTDEEGMAKFERLPPGPIAIAISAEGFLPGEEAASVVAGQTSEVSIGLLEVKQRVPATITGLVRSTVGGKPVAAQLEIPQLQLKTRASASGAFSFRIEGGTYTVNISARGYRSQSKSVTVRDGDQAIFNVDLHPR